MTPTGLQDAVMAALKSAPKPISEEMVLEIAVKTLSDLKAGKESQDFQKWFKQNGAWLTERVNG